MEQPLEEIGRRQIAREGVAASDADRVQRCADGAPAGAAAVAPRNVRRVVLMADP